MIRNIDGGSSASLVAAKGVYQSFNENVALIIFALLAFRLLKQRSNQA